MAKIKSKKQIKKNNVFKTIGIVVFIVSLICLFLVKQINVLPMNYLLLVGLVILVMNVVNIYLLLSKNWKKRLFGTIFSLLLIVIFSFAIFYEKNTIDFFKNISGSEYKTLNYSVIVLKENKYSSLKDIKNEDVGILDKKEYDGFESAIKYLDKKIDVTYKEKESVNDLEKSLLKNELSVILLENTYLEIAKEENKNFADKIKVIYKFSIDIPTKDLTKSVDITKKPFNIFISGIDTYGKISSVSRSDVNMVMTVNPNTHKILLTSIPRDYYVKLHGTTGYKDKITHAGIYGIDKSIKTVEDLLDTDINYYVKVNFTSLIKIVDAINGVEVNSPHAFKTYDSKYSYSKGINYLNGEQALYFARERKAFAAGDRTRNENQQLLLSAIIDKVSSKALIVKYNSILKSVDKSFVTNLDNESITNFIKKEIKEGNNYTIESINLNGTDSSNYTYSYKSAKAYVMEPDKKSVEDAKAKINEILKEKVK